MGCLWQSSLPPHPARSRRGAGGGILLSPPVCPATESRGLSAGRGSSSWISFCVLSSRARSHPLFAWGQTLRGGEQNGGAELAVNYLVLRRAGPSSAQRLSCSAWVWLGLGGSGSPSPEVLAACCPLVLWGCVVNSTTEVPRVKLLSV